ncbi:ABC transporter permease [Microbacterium lacus]|uniref:ABC transporter permease n=1 Tax=Microbacterium lacus TaxID=415217 RepID=A0ABN2GPW5_9MICO
MFVAWRDLRFARGRFVLIATVVTLISILVGFLSGLTGGLAAQNVTGILTLGADRIVLAPSAPGASPTWSDSTVTADQLSLWKGADGVDDAIPLGVSQIRAQSAGERVAVTVFATPDGAQGAPAADGAIALSAPAAVALGADVGDVITIADDPYEVTSIAGDDWYSHTPVVRMALSQWQQLQSRTGGEADTATAILVTGAADWASVDASAGTTSQSSLGSLTLLPAFRSEIGSLLLIVVLLFGISALVIGAFFTVWTMQRRGDVAILKALGATDGALVRDALGQALVVLTAGTLIGTVIVLIAGLAVSGTLPYLLSPWTTIAPAVLLIAVGLIGAAFALRAVTTASPLTALGSNR